MSPPSNSRTNPPEGWRTEHLSDSSRPSHSGKGARHGFEDLGGRWCGPPGYDKLSIGSQQIPIRNQVFVIDPKLAVSPGTLSGPARTATINLRVFAAP